MEAWILDENFVALPMIIDGYKSFIWTIRYTGHGDFELLTAMDPVLLQFLRKDNYLWLDKSNRVMLIEDLEIKTDVLDGNYLTVTGRSLESLLTRRIVWEHTTINGNLQVGIKKLINENVINPKDPKRKIHNFIFTDSTDQRVKDLTVDVQYHGEELYEVIKELCETNDLGFRVSLTEDDKFNFELYMGDDRSYDQSINPYIEFSKDFDNIINSEYLESVKEMKNVSLVGGEGEGSDRKVTTVGDVSGLKRREVFTDASGVSSQTQSGNISNAEYMKLLNEAGTVDLEEYKFIKLFDGAVDSGSRYRFDKDFFMGDIVQLKNEYGIENRSRVTEIIYSQDESGYTVYPTFVAIEEED